MPNPKIRTAHFLSSRLETLAGGDLVILNLLKYLNREKFHPVIVSFFEKRNPGTPLIVNIAKERGIDTRLLEVKGRFDLGAVDKLKRFIDEEKIDILHCHGYKPDVIASLISKKGRPKLVTTLHGWWIGANPKLRFYDWLDLRAIKNFDMIITVADHIKEGLIKKGFPAGNVKCIPNGVDIKEMNSCDGSGVRRELKIAPGSAVVGIAGRLNKEKGHEYLLRSAERLKNVTLLIVGTGPLENYLKVMAERLGISDRTIFTGFRSDARRYIAAMDIFALPSLSEGLPLALMEAMAAGKPVIASDIGGIPQVVADGVTGLLVEPRNPSQLEKAISKLITDKEFSSFLAEKGRDFIEKNFSLEIMVRRYEDLYLELSKNERKA